MTISFILVLELSGKKRRGLFIGLVNSGFTTGVSLGAVVAGALVTGMGWVNFPASEL
jgi:MFS family permease